MKAGSHSAKIGKNSPVGDIGSKRNSAASGFFKRKIKSAGGTDAGTSHLPVRAFKAAGGNEK